jgi:hypothetical protein
MEMSNGTSINTREQAGRRTIFEPAPIGNHWSRLSESCHSGCDGQQYTYEPMNGVTVISSTPLDTGATTYMYRSSKALAEYADDEEKDDATVQADIDKAGTANLPRFEIGSGMRS